MPDAPAQDFYVHNWSPFILRFTENFGIRWYGLAYVVGFLAAWWLLLKLVRRGACELKERQVGDFITLAAIFGVMLGGRLGYMLFYDLDDFLHNPLIFFKFLSGGMASHGGILGLFLFTGFYAWRHRISWPGLGDNLVSVAPVGLFLGRIANFINGELYGRATEGPWAMKFPSELADRPEDCLTAARAAAAVDPDFAAKLADLQNADPSLSGLSHLLVESSRGNPALTAEIAPFLTPRHPSQLYEAGLEGILLFAILFTVRWRFPRLFHGILTGMFFILYAAFRVAVENLREPDFGKSLILGLTRGQFYSLWMFLIGAAFILWGLRARRRNAAPARPQAG
ncbi:MAG TPA: prolipoprotein diacylglyceryl transferase [Verrucomicrobiales bacterium]|nr:prolipoprotein diacylglyceryl transferase [Verrucomicrobiae bacterium]MCP5553953.1 prolipoprotein diacylglyceryl transferase [Akkermansiaceae bacterium]HRX54534.1 prolipoprotein diacylglyceryl transferase [Verrucomicrobiales bacterium]